MTFYAQLVAAFYLGGLVVAVYKIEIVECQEGLREKRLDDEVLALVAAAD